MGKLFGTDGVRGIANSDLSSELAYKLGRVGGYFLTKGKKRPKMVVGMDTRISGDMLEGALSAGLNSAGIDVLYLGVLPTPAVACMIKILEADGGVMITASHNPVEYNGIKFFNEKGLKLTDSMENSIEEYILNDLDIETVPVAGEVGRKIRIENPVRKYMDFLKDTINVDFKGLKVAVDCGNGAVYKAAPELLNELGAQVYVIHNDPNGININVNCGSTKPEEIQKLVLETGADIGLSFDGDADRLIAADENGNIVDGDHVLAICGISMKEKGNLKSNTVIGTVMTNMGLDICLGEKDINIIKTNVGDRYVLEEMLSGNHSIGGEQSGHIIFLDYNTTGDGLLTAIQLLSVMKEKNTKLSKLANVMKVMPQVLVNARVAEDKKKAYMEDETIRNKIEDIEKHFDGKGRVLIRPSGTEPLVRVMIEGENLEELKMHANELAALIEVQLNN
ncbi:phosphoglucosamine mutase [Sedimentibacter saalensis]|uniref:Phosphoglucosamine mutase n=1 Tax=Sedimentibacter saalensis TaxID=130788 RepID=A0A562JBD6_9FIRM|nr:phosphoglucosamine mutase [Sedimentibacter saalensis]MEA5096865.1 phosphoglucosamine mutase [Sedimentibacter saalensis]TWH80502.1 phosphoglucosamine mutase [Sedimentibacter saalensis]